MNEKRVLEEIITLEAKKFEADEDSGEYPDYEEVIELNKLYELLGRELTEEEMKLVELMAEEGYFC